jgi:S-(hydroxymethyl)glutathione dehydrogenase/alcohol dehydrogenase
MKAAVMRGVDEPFKIEDVTVSKPGPQEVLIRTAASGVCHSDLHIIDGSLPMRFPAILGHEGAGVVEQVGSQVSYVKPGDHVIANYTGFCGHCASCIDGKSIFCSSPQELRRTREEEPRITLGGKRLIQMGNLATFAEQMLMHQNNVVKITKDIPLDRAALIGCGVTAGAGAVINTAQVRAGQTVVVVGCGGVGLTAINAAAISGAARIIAVDIFDSKLELAKSMGATDLINSKNQDPIEAIQEMTKGGVDHAFEAIGLQQTITQCMGAIKPGGVVTVMGVFKPGTQLMIPGEALFLEKKIQGSLMGSGNPRTDFHKLINHYLQGKLHLDLLISKRSPLEDINEAFNDMKKGGAARTVITFDL